jgi:hypothetical protein
MTTPVIPRDVVEWLERVFSDACLPADVSPSHRELDMRIGQRSVLDRIRKEHDRQNQNIIRR